MNERTTLKTGKPKYGTYVRRGLAGTVADARAMRLPEIRAWLTLLWTMGGFWPRVAMLTAWMAVAALSSAAIIGWGPSGSVSVVALIVLATVLVGSFFYVVTSPRDPWQDSWWHPDQ